MMEPARSPAHVFAHWATTLSQIPEEVRRTAQRAVFDTVAGLGTAGPAEVDLLDFARTAHGP